MRITLFICFLIGCSGLLRAAAPDVTGGAAAGAEIVFQEAGECSLSVSGKLLSEHDDEPMGYANVFSDNPQTAVIADGDGSFTLTGLCPGPQTLTFTHIGCDNETLVVDLRRDTVLTAYLHHHDNYTETVVVTAGQNARYGNERDNLATADLASGLERITGVSSLRSGTSAAKPIVDGVFGNRLSLQNNGIAQSGQQWGNDHAPEIDPWVAAYVRVVDGVEALKYAGPTVAATVLIEPAPLREDEKLSGKVAYGFRSNGRGHTLNGRISNGGRLAYRLSGTLKRIGDQQAPDYFLTNTGRAEGNAAAQLAYFHDERWTTRLYASLFTANIGVLRGSHIGNLTDLQDALTREVPFFTTETFTYRINNPRQFVTHTLVKSETEFRPDEANRFLFRYGGQLNNRKEYDVRRGERDNDPSLSLLQWSHLLELAWHRELGPNQHFDANIQYDFVLNDNQPGTGVFPLIPDYNSNRVSGYLAYHHEKEDFQYHAGLRFDHQLYEAITINRDIGCEEPGCRIDRFEHTFNSVGASLEARRNLSPATVLRGGLTLRQRAPQINELYANGLHQGVSGIEEGDRTLAPEVSLKLSAGITHNAGRLSLNGGVFFQPIKDYIFLEPQLEFRQTVRGFFPLFLYRAGDAVLYGTNLRAFYQISKHWETDARLAIVRGYNRSEDRPLVYVPSDNLRLGMTYRRSGWTASAEGLFVARQNRLDPEQDFQETPPGYALLDLSVGREWALPQNRTLHLRAAAQNALNSSYRDYLDRQRYFADAPGRNVEIRVSYEW